MRKKEKAKNYYWFIFGLILTVVGIVIGSMLVFEGLYNPILISNYTMWEDSWSSNGDRFQFYGDFGGGHLYSALLGANEVNIISEIESNTNSLISRTYSDRLSVLNQYGIEDKYGEVIDWAWSPTGDEIAFITRDNSENLIIINTLNGDTIFQAVPQQLIRLSRAKYSPEIQLFLSALFIFAGIGMIIRNREVKTKIFLMGIIVCMIFVCYVCSLMMYRLTLFTS